MSEMTDAQRKAVETVAKLLALSARAGTPAEASVAAEKAQLIMEAHNLSTAEVERAQGKTSGKREQLAQSGGMYKYQRDLWSWVAELNFCLMLQYTERQPHPKYRDRTKMRRMMKLVGRVENVAAANALGGYLEGTVERLCRERLHEKGEGNAQFYSRWAVSFREGAVSEIVWRLYERRQQRMSEEEEKRKAEAERMTRGVSTATALTLRDVAERERDANLDVVYGEGFSARRAERRARAAAAEAQAERELAEWAAANPEAARRAEEKRRKAEERRAARPARERQERPKDWGAYQAGREVGKTISIDPQVADAPAERKRIK